jgi:hypothetical protein
MKPLTIRMARIWIVCLMGMALAAGCGGPNEDESIGEATGALTGDPCTRNAQCNDGNPCTIDRCVLRKCAYTNIQDGTACSDGSACTKNDVCGAGKCVGGPAVVCAPPNQCQTASGCNPNTGKCVYLAKMGAACDDGNSCTQTDRCTASTGGVCRGTTRPNRSTCDDGNPNTVGDMCTRGTCAGVDHCVGVTCTASDQCHVAACDHASGMCSSPAAPNGTTCDDGNASTVGDMCSAGICGGDVNECLTNNGGCSPSATCTNTLGSRMCACNPGFMGDGVTCSPVASGEDTTPPTLTALSFSPSSIDTTSADATVTVSYSAIDDLSGIQRIEVDFTSPSGSQVRLQDCLPAGGPTSLSSTCSVTFQALGEAGAWTAEVLLWDVVGNHRYLSPTDLQVLGFPSTVSVSSSEVKDSTPPTLTALSLSPATLDTTSANATVTVSYSATDDLSGIQRIEVDFTSPSGSQVRLQTCVPNGSPLSVSSTCPVTFQAFGEVGAWTAEVILWDVVGNHRSLSPTDLQLLGFPSTMIVSSNQDTTPPLLTALSFSPASIDTTSADATVTVSYSATDDLSGIQRIEVDFTSPSGSQVRLQDCLPAGGPTSLSSTCSVTFQAFGEAGVWKAELLLWDVVGNHRYASPTDLQGLGFPSSIQVN